MSAKNQEPNEMFMPSASADAPKSDVQSQNDNLAGLFGVADESPVEAPTASRLKSRTFGMLLVVVVAAGTLMIMRQLGLGPRLDLVDVKISYPLDDARSSDVRKHQKMLADLRDSSDAPQVPLESVKKNPFLLGIHSEVAEASTPTPSRQFDPEEYARQQRRQLIQSTLDGLTLNSVLGGAVSVARISGRSVRVGDMVADLFVVKSIHGRVVELSVDNAVYELVVGK